MPNRSLRAILATLVLLAGCNGGGAIRGNTTPVVSDAGFLSDYARLAPVDGVDGSYRYVDRSVDLRPYNKVLIAPVQVFVTDDADYRGIQPETLQRMTDAFRTEFVGALLSGYRVVNAPGPDVLQLRLAITGVQPVSPPLGATDFIPIKAIYNVARGAAGAAPRVAEMTAEAEILDAQGRVVAAVVATRKADRTLAQGEQITWADMQAIAAAWAKNLRQQLDYARNYAAR